MKANSEINLIKIDNFYNLKNKGISENNFNQLDEVRYIKIEGKYDLQKKIC